MLPPLRQTKHSADRRLIGFTLALAAVAAGCTGLSMSTQESDAALRAVHPKDEIVITFHDGGRVSTKPYQHRWADSVGAYQVRGTRRPQPTSRGTHAYSGWLKASEVDSIRRIGSAATPVNVLYLSDGSLIYATPTDMVEVPRRETPGFWCTGEYLRPNDDGVFGSDSTFTGTIDPERVRSVEVINRELQAASHALQGFGMIVAIPLLVTAGTFLVWAWGR